MIATFLSLVPVARAVTISMNIPGVSSTATSTPGAWVANFYQFALMIGGVLAFGIIVYGGVKYMASAGNPSGQGDAKEWIEAALLGLLLLVGAYFILDVINPQLLNLNLPTLPAVNIQQTNPPSLTPQDNYNVKSITDSGVSSAYSGPCTSNSCGSGLTCNQMTNNGDVITHICISGSTPPTQQPKVPTCDIKTCSGACIPTAGGGSICSTNGFTAL